MTWENYGTKWNIDHITPQSFLQFNNYEHPNFLEVLGIIQLTSLVCKYRTPSEGEPSLQRRNRVCLKATNNKKTIDIERQDGYAYVSQ